LSEELLLPQKREAKPCGFVIFLLSEKRQKNSGGFFQSKNTQCKIRSFEKCD